MSDATDLSQHLLTPLDVTSDAAEPSGRSLRDAHPSSEAKEANPLKPVASLPDRLALGPEAAGLEVLQHLRAAALDMLFDSPARRLSVPACQRLDDRWVVDNRQASPTWDRFVDVARNVLRGGPQEPAQA